jgi:hypothetical protein
MGTPWLVHAYFHTLKGVEVTCLQKKEPQHANKHAKYPHFKGFSAQT